MTDRVGDGGCTYSFRWEAPHKTATVIDLPTRRVWLKGNLGSSGPRLNAAALSRPGLGGFVYAYTEGDTLECAVDAMGIRTLYTAVSPSGRLFSTSLRRLLALMQPFQAETQIDRTRLHELLIYRYTTGEQTLVNGIQRLLPGFVYEVTPSSNVMRKSAFWQVRFDEPFDRRTRGEILDDVDRMFLDVIRRVDGPAHESVATALTGGVDSSYMQAKVNQIFGKDLCTYSMGFGEGAGATPDTVYARTASEHLQTRHRVLDTSEAEVFASIRDCIRIGEYPLQLYHTAPYSLTTWKLPPQYEWIFSGYGADLNFGESLRKFWLARSLRTSRVVPRRVLKFVGRANVPRVSRYAVNFADWWDDIGTVDAFIRAVPRIDSPLNLELVGSLVGELSDDLWKPKRDVIAAARPRNIIDVAMALSMPAMTATLSMWSRLADADGRTLLFPFADPSIIDCAKNIHPEMRLRWWGLVEKPLMKQLASRYLPRRMVYRSKRTGELPIASWLRLGSFDRMIRTLDHAWIGIDYDKVVAAASVPDQYSDFLLWNYVNLAIWRAEVLPKGRVRVVG